MNILEITDKTGRKIRLTEKQWRHIQKHPHIHESLDRINGQLLLINQELKKIKNKASLLIRK